MTWENPTFADLLAICSSASRVGPIKEKDEFGEVQIIGYHAIPAYRQRTLAVAMLVREMLARVTQDPNYAHGLNQKLDHFCWHYAEFTNNIDVAHALANPFADLRGGSTGGPRAAGLFAIWGVKNVNFAQLYQSGGAFTPTLMPMSEILASTPLLKNEVTALHAANHDIDETVADEIDSVYAAARPAYVTQLQASHPSRGFA